MFLLCMCFMACLAVRSITLVHMYFYLSSNNKLSVDCFVKLEEYLIGDRKSTRLVLSILSIAAPLCFSFSADNIRL